MSEMMNYENQAEEVISPAETKKKYRNTFNTAIGALLIAFLLFQFMVNIVMGIGAGILSGIKMAEFSANGTEITEEVIQEVITTISTDSLLIFGSNLLGALIAYPIAALIGGKMLKTNRKEYLKKEGASGKIIGIGVLLGLGAQAVGSLLGNVVMLIGKNAGLAMNTFTPDFSDSIAANVFMVLFVCLVGPFFEEVIFRGLLLPCVSKGVSPWFGIILTSVLFALYHGNPFQIVGAFFMGISFALVTQKAGTIVPSVIMHIVMNSFSVFMAYVTMKLPESQAEILSIGIMIALSIVGILVLIAFRKYLLPKKQEFVSGENVKAFPALLTSVTFWVFVVITGAICLIAAVGI